MKYLEVAGSGGHANLRYCAIAEAISRGARTIDWGYHDRLDERDSGRSADALRPAAFSGFGVLREAGVFLMVVPVSFDFHASQVEEDGVSPRHIRKARDVREHRRMGPAGGGGGLAE